MTLSALINEHYGHLNANDLHILHYVQANASDVTDLSIAELARRCTASTAAVLRTTKKLGFSGFSEFKYFLKRDNIEPHQQLRYSLDELSADIQQTIKMFQSNSASAKLYPMLKNAGQIYAYGTGHGQRLMINEFARCMLNLKKNVVVLPASTELEIASANFKAEDLLFMVSLSGNITSLKKTILQLGISQIPIISITNLHNNELASLAKYSFYFQTSHIGTQSKLNQSSFITLHLLFHLIYEGYADYLLGEGQAEA